ncbi:unnamed protein product [Aphanomyces euteiches]
MPYGTLWLDDEESLVFDFEAILPTLHEPAPVILVDEDGKKDFKRGTVVCRHWLRGLCMKGDNCEFLHQYDMSKMPECRWGMECQVPECPFRHVPDEDRMECAFYKQGFCSHGAACRYRHVKLPREECPVIADFSLQSKVAEEESAKRRKAQPVNEFFKIAICKHWEKQGTCPFGEECHFAHGEKELRPFPKDLHGGGNRGGGGDMGGGGGGGGPSAAHAPFKPPEAPVFSLPDAEGTSVYILLRSHSYQNLAVSVHHQKFAAAGAALQTIQDAMTMADQVFLLLSVTPSHHFQGLARIVQVPSDDTGVSLADRTVPFQKWRGTFGVEWLRTCEIPYESADTIPTTTDTPLSKLPDGAELAPECGHALLEKMFLHPMIRLHMKSVEDEGKLPGGALELANRRRHAAESVANFVDPTLLMPSANITHRWQVDQPGFVFACNGTTIDECFGRMMFGLAKDHEQIAAKNVQIGTPLFLLNMSDRHILGMFEAVSPVVANMVPNAFAQGPNVPSPFPIQVRFQFIFDAPPILNDLLKNIPGLERGVRIGPLSLTATQALANIFAERCGATNLDENGKVIDLKARKNKLEEQFIVGIDEDKEFSVVQKILGPQDNHIKRIISDAGGNAKVRLRGRGSGVKEANGEEAKEPLMLVVSADNDRSFRVACDAARSLLGSVHHEFQGFLHRKHGGRGGGYGGPPPPMMGGMRPPFRGGPPKGGPPPRAIQSHDAEQRATHHMSRELSHAGRTCGLNRHVGTANDKPTRHEPLHGVATQLGLRAHSTTFHMRGLPQRAQPLMDLILPAAEKTLLVHRPLFRSMAPVIEVPQKLLQISNDPNYTHMNVDVFKNTGFAIGASHFIHSLQGAGKYEILEVYGHNDKQFTTSVIQFGANLCGHEGVVHGGCISTVIDELFQWTAYWTTGRIGYTANLNVNYRRPLPVERPGIITAQFEKRDGRKLYMNARLEDNDGQLYTEATTLFLLPKDESS